MSRRTGGNSRQTKCVTFFILGLLLGDLPSFLGKREKHLAFHPLSCLMCPIAAFRPSSSSKITLSSSPFYMLYHTHVCTFVYIYKCIHYRSNFGGSSKTINNSNKPHKNPNCPMTQLLCSWAFAQWIPHFTIKILAPPCSFLFYSLQQGNRINVAVHQQENG